MSHLSTFRSTFFFFSFKRVIRKRKEIRFILFRSFFLFTRNENGSPFAGRNSGSEFRVSKRSTPRIKGLKNFPLPFSRIREGSTFSFRLVSRQNTHTHARVLKIAGTAVDGNARCFRSPSRAVTDQLVNLERRKQRMERNASSNATDLFFNPEGRTRSTRKGKLARCIVSNRFESENKKLFPTLSRSQLDLAIRIGSARRV